MVTRIVLVAAIPALVTAGEARPGVEAALARLEASAGHTVVVRWGPDGAARSLLGIHGPLTAPDGRAPVTIATGFVATQTALLGIDLDQVELVPARRFTTHGDRATIVHLEQWIDGLPLHRGEIRLAVARDGSIVSLTRGAVARRASLESRPALGPAAAVRAAAAMLGADLADVERLSSIAEASLRLSSAGLTGDAWVEPVWFAEHGTAQLAWRARLEPSGGTLHEVVVDATSGELLAQTRLTHAISGLVFAEHPDAGPQSRMPFYDDTIFTDPRWPLGWLTGDETIGNVVDAKDDWPADDELTSGQRAIAIGDVFDHAFTDSWAITGDPAPDLMAAVTQVFYFANVFHDWTYGFGFDEPAGNWQNDNFGRGGREGDRLYADVQDGWQIGQRNNFNISVPPDGTSPRLQVFLFSATDRRDPSFDGDLVFHELTHGLVNRLVGTASTTSCLTGLQGRAMQEGWGDFYPVAYWENPLIGEYTLPPTGARSHPYDAYPACHRYDGADFCPPPACAGFDPVCGPSDEGQLWAATLVSLLTAMEVAEGPAGRDVTLQLVTDGLKLAPCDPTFLDARDAILLADVIGFAGAHQCLIWQVFADRAMGFSSSTTGPDDDMPVGATDLPPWCGPGHLVQLDRARYGCDDDLRVTVHDGGAVGPISLALVVSSGDRETVIVVGVPPTFVSAVIPVVIGVPTIDDGVLQVMEGDTVEAQYMSSTATAPIDCLLDVATAIDVAGGCSADSLVWPIELPQILDAGETVAVTVLIENRESRPFQDVQVELIRTPPLVAAADPGPLPAGDLAPFTGTVHVTFQISAATLLAHGTGELEFTVTARGFHGTRSPAVHTVPLHGDYQLNTATAGVETFEATDGGYVHQPWIVPGPDEWQWGSDCGSSSGVNAWRVGPPGCSGDATEQSSVLISAPLDPITTLRVSWYPVELFLDHRLNLGNGDIAFVLFAEPGPLAKAPLAFDTLRFFTSADNTGSRFEARGFSFSGDDTLGAGIDSTDGLVWLFNFDTLQSAQPSENWVIDDVEVRFEAADVVAQPIPSVCLAGYTGSLTGRSTGAELSLYAHARPGEVQHAGDGLFFRAGDDWNAFDVEFPTATTPGEVLVAVASGNPDDGRHVGVVGLAARAIADPSEEAFGDIEVAEIPRPVGPLAAVAPAAPIALAWAPIVESGTEAAIVGYEVYRIDAEALPPAVSTIDDYLGVGTLVGDTTGRARIDEFIDTAPALVTPPLDQYSYVIRPMLRCDTGLCGGSVGLTFGGDESTPGKPNLSGDNLVSDGTTTLARAVFVGSCAPSPYNLDVPSLRLVAGAPATNGCATDELHATWQQRAPGPEPYNVHEIVGRSALIADRQAATPPGYREPFATAPLPCCVSVALSPLELCVAGSDPSAALAAFQVSQADDCTASSRSDEP